MKPITLSPEESGILKKVTNDELRLLAQLKDTGGFAVLGNLINTLTDLEKNLFFAENEMKYTPNELAVKHAYARGSISGNVRLVRLIVGATAELAKREELTRKNKEKAINTS